MRILPTLQGFFLSRLDVRHVVSQRQYPAELWRVVGRIGTHVLRTARMGLRSMDRNAVEGWLSQLYVVPIGGADDQP